jgi:hypothetical protein
MHGSVRCHGHLAIPWHGSRVAAIEKPRRRDRVTAPGRSLPHATGTRGRDHRKAATGCTRPHAVILIRGHTTTASKAQSPLAPSSCSRSMTLRHGATSQGHFFYLFCRGGCKVRFLFGSKRLEFSVLLRVLPCRAGLVGAVGRLLRNGFEVYQPSRRQL